MQSLVDLPSQLDFEWQDYVSPNPTPMLGTARNLGGELEVVGTPRNTTDPKAVGMDTFVEVSQIAQEAVRDATLQPLAEVSSPLHTTTAVVADATHHIPAEVPTFLDA